MKGWIYRCQQFFDIDGIAEENKVRMASMHMFDKALSWHKQFIKINGEDVTWQVYEQNKVVLCKSIKISLKYF